MSTINVDNYGDGTSSVPASAVLEGTAKAWVNYEMDANTIHKDYNISSVTDNGTGDFDQNFTNNMLDVDYAVASANTEVASGAARNFSSGADFSASSTSSVNYKREDSDGSANDGAFAGAGNSVFGDLA